MKKTFSNTYIFIYSAVLVVVAALILTVVRQPQAFADQEPGG